MTVSKTPGGQQASEKFQKQQAQKEGLGSDSASSKTGVAHNPGSAAVASDSGSTNVGIDNKATNVPGEKGISGVPVSSEPTSGNANKQ